jgi:hypothetical protein
LRNEIDGGILAASVNFDIELDSVAFVEAGQAGSLYRADVDECVRLAVITRDEAKALHAVKELDRAGRLLAGQLTLRRCFALLDSNDITDNLQIACGNLAAAIDELEFQLLTFGQTFQSRTFNSTDVNEHIFTTVFTLDEAETLAGIEEFYDAFALADDLRRHSATRSAAAAAEAITAAAAAAKTVAAAAAEPAFASRVALLPAEERIKIVFTEPITLVASPTATTSVKTHL